MERMHDVGKEFFEMPVEDRACLYSEDPFEMVRIATSFNIQKEKKRSWRDSLSVGIWVEQIVPHRLDVGIVLGI